VKLYLDDLRDPSETYTVPEDWTVFRDPFDFMWFLRRHWGIVTAISLDNDLGKDVEGRQVLGDIEGWFLGIHPPFEIFVHSANPPAAKEMNLTIQRMKERRDAQG
jgi:hypothetical protein